MRPAAARWSPIPRPNALEGLTAEQLASSQRRAVSFRVARDAGQFQCEGVAPRRAMLGECCPGPPVLRPVAGGAGRGTGRHARALPHERAQRRRQLSRSAARPALSDAERGRTGAAPASMAWGLKYMRDMALAGFPPERVDSLILAHDHGMDASLWRGRDGRRRPCHAVGGRSGPAARSTGSRPSSWLACAARAWSGPAPPRPSNCTIMASRPSGSLSPCGTPATTSSASDLVFPSRRGVLADYMAALLQRLGYSIPADRQRPSGFASTGGGERVAGGSAAAVATAA